MSVGQEFSREDKVKALREMIREAQAEAEAEFSGSDKYRVSIKNVYAGREFDGWPRHQADWRKALAEAILHTEAALYLTEALEEEAS